MSNKYNLYVEMCEQALKEAADKYLQVGSNVSDAAKYSMDGGGKHVRGILVLAVCDMLAGKLESAKPFSAGVEMMHTFSLIHDDLPCMDNDNMRRGKPACHIKYGEANALLAGDLLAIAALQALACADTLEAVNAEAVSVLAFASGAKGMIYGQELDIQHENLPTDIETLEKIHKNKTGALILASVKLGILAAGEQLEKHPVLLRFAENLGLVFQIVDDILDVTADQSSLGKPVGSDEASGKTTYATLFGIEKAKCLAAEITQDMVNQIKQAYADKSGFLSEYALNLSSRLF